MRIAIDPPKFRLAPTSLSRLPGGTLVGSALMAAFLGALGCNAKRIKERDTERIFATTCAKCHGIDGTGVPEMRAKLGVRNLSDAVWQATITDDGIASSIRRGKKNMPSWANVLDEQQIEGLVRKVRSLAK